MKARIACVICLAASMGEVFHPKVGWTNVSYASSQAWQHGAPHPIHSYTVFEPHGVAPPGGWMLKVWCMNGGYGTSLPSVITAAQVNLHRDLRAGRMVICLMASVPRGGSTTNNVDDATFDPANGLYGAAWRNNGVWIPEEVSNPIGGIHPYFDPAAYTQVKDFAMFTQHIALQSTALNFSLDLTTCGGNSMGSIAAAFTFWGKDRSNMWTTKVDPQDSVNTAGFYKLAFLDRFPAAFWPVFDFDGVGLPPDLVPIGTDAYMFPKTAAGLYGTPAGVFAGVSIAYRNWMSALTYATEASVVAANATKPAYIFTAEPTYAGPPYDETHFDAELATHSIWHGRAMKLRFPAGVHLVARGAVYDAAYDDKVMDTPEEIYDDQILWSNAILGYHWPLRGSIQASPVINAQLTDAVGEYERLHFIVASKFRTDIAEAYDVPVAFDNKPFTAPDDALFIRLHVTVDQTSQVQCGVRNTHRKFGTATATICTPLAGGSRPAMTMADRIFAAFANRNEDGVIYRAPGMEPARQWSAAAQEAGDTAGASWQVDVTIPFIADSTPDVRPEPIAGVPPTFEAVANAVRTRFHELVTLQEGVPVHYDNGAVQAVAAPVWTRLTIVQGATQHITGEGDEAQFRTAGIAIAQIFVVLKAGDKPALQLADRINAALRAVSVGGVVFHTPLVRNVGSDGAYWQVNVSLPFTVDRAIPVVA